MKIIINRAVTSLLVLFFVASYPAYAGGKTEVSSTDYDRPTA